MIDSATSNGDHEQVTFRDKLRAASQSSRSLLCVGLDPDPALMPGLDVFDFNREIIDATSDLVCAYKPNLAFYEALGVEGLRALEKTLAHVPSHVPVIGDCKRGDIGNTAAAYAKAMFEVFGFDAVTVNPYLGGDSIAPFVEYGDRGVFVLCKTSNPGSADLQDLECRTDAPADRARPLFEVVALRAREWNKSGNVGLVVGATHPDEIAAIRGLCPEMTLLVPGVGAQGGDLAAAVRHGVGTGESDLIISVSRQVIFASSGEDFAQAAREAALKLRERIAEHVDAGQ